MTWSVVEGEAWAGSRMYSILHISAKHAISSSFEASDGAAECQK